MRVELEDGRTLEVRGLLFPHPEGAQRVGA
jgi:hypothetical protein